MIILLADVNNLTYLCKFVNKPRRDFLYSAAEFRVFCCHLYVLHSFAILNCRLFLRRLYDDFSQKKSTKPGFYAENRFFLESIHIHDSPCVPLRCVLHIISSNWSHCLYFPRYFAQFFVKKQILPSTIPMEHFTKAKLTHIFWQNPLESYDIPRLFRRSVQFLSKTVFLVWDKHKKIHKSHRRSISSYILWHRIVLFVPQSRINAHTFHFFRRTPAGYCPAPANAATFPCHTPPRSPL